MDDISLGIIIITALSAIIVSLLINELVYHKFKNSENSTKKIRIATVILKIVMLLIFTLLNILFSDIFNFELMFFLPGVILQKRFSEIFK